MPSVHLHGARWRKSSRSANGTNANCVEVVVIGAVTAVRDSKNPTGPVLILSAAGWRALTRHG